MFFNAVIRKLNFLQYKFFRLLILFLLKAEKKKIVNFGSKTSGWDIVPNDSLVNSEIISCGVGEDISFEIELINKYNCRVILIDPTPRSIHHYNNIIKNLGHKKKTKYSSTANQKITSYDLKKIKKKNLILIKKAIYNKNNKVLNFFSPINKNNVSHSLILNENLSKKNFLSIKTISIDKIIKTNHIRNLNLIKLDIEGIAPQIILDMMTKKIFPKQICFELDELNYSDFGKFNQILLLKKISKKNGYALIKTTDEMNFILSRI